MKKKRVSELREKKNENKKKTKKLARIIEKSPEGLKYFKGL